MIVDDSDKHSEFMEELVSSLMPDDFEDLERDARVDDYVLVEFRILGKKKFYTGIVTKERESDSYYEVSFFRTCLKKMNAFMKPQVKDLAAVNQSQIKMIPLQPVLDKQRDRGDTYHLELIFLFFIWVVLS
jgi:hypothetical protein